MDLANGTCAYFVSPLLLFTSLKSIGGRNCTYTFSPHTGLVERHTVDSIEPAPHESFYEAIRGLRLGLGGSAPGIGPHGGAAACPVRLPVDNGRGGRGSKE